MGRCLCMKYFAEDFQHIKVDCTKCGKVSNVERENCIEIFNGYDTVNPVTCNCGHTSNKIKGKKKDTRIRCPKCRSEQISSGTKGFSLGKAAVGGVLLGGVGLLGGVIGSKKVVLNCMSCGNRWEAGSK